MFFITILWACVFSIPQDRCPHYIFTSCHLLSLKFCSTFTMFFWQYCMWAYTINWILIFFRNIHIYLRILQGWAVLLFKQNSGSVAKFLFEDLSFFKLLTISFRISSIILQVFRKLSGWAASLFFFFKLFRGSVAKFFCRFIIFYLANNSFLH